MIYVENSTESELRSTLSFEVRKFNITDEQLYFLFLPLKLSTLHES